MNVGRIMNHPAVQKSEIRIIRSEDRPRWRNEWLDSRQSFPATGNFDLAANAHGVLMVHNDDVVDAGEGLDTHQHRDVEIVTWVVDGVLNHRDSSGAGGELRPGTVQVMSAGRGIRHSEGNATSRLDGVPARVVQMWVAPGVIGATPSYAEANLGAALAEGTLITVTSGLARHSETTALPLNNPHAALHAAQPRSGAEITLPIAGYGHLYVISGRLELRDGNPQPDTLGPGDAARFTNTGATIRVTEDAHLLYWEMHAHLGAG